MKGKVFDPLVITEVRRVVQLQVLHTSQFVPLMFADPLQVRNVWWLMN